MKVLIVDDNGVPRKILKATLEHFGHEVVEAKDGAQALELFDCQPIRVIVSDWVMPELDGLTLCQKVRQRSTATYTYFILLTGEMTTREDYLKAMDDGVDDFLTKPVDREALWSRLRVAERIVGLTARVKQLEGIIPICAYCRRIQRDDKVYEKMEVYIQSHSSAVFSHGICPECMEKLSSHQPQ